MDKIKIYTIFLKTLLILLTIALVISAIRPYDRTTYLLEIIPALIALPILISADKKYPISRLLYPNNLGRFIDWSKKQPVKQLAVFSNLPLTNHINAHIRTQHFRHRNRTIRILVIFHNRKQGTTHRKP